MTVAYQFNQLDHHVFSDHVQSLQDSVKNTIGSHTEFKLERIRTQDNRVKYADIGSQRSSDDYLTEVFQLMKQLNEEGVQSKTLGRLSPNGVAFNEALEKICSAVATQLGGSAITYVELGPEPVKTSFIIQALLRLGVVIERYIAVDINPMSSAQMKPVLEGLLPEASLEFVTASFEEIRLEDLLEDRTTPALITMLGFQEGNDEPRVVNDWLRNIARSGDFLLSETQLHTPGRVGKIPEFYAHPAMQRFSRNAFERAIDHSLPTLNRFFLLPVDLQDGLCAQVAILGEEFNDAITGRSLYVSNFCLKLTLDQYRAYRQHDGFFEIVGETFTDDETLHFQLSRRT